MGDVTDVLTNLWLQNNTMTGTLPASLTNATNLENVLLGNNQFSGSIPAISSSSMAFFDARSNLLTGTIPSSLFSDSLSFLYLQWNQLSGPIPSEYSSADSLSDLYLSNNTLTGEIPGISDDQLTELTEFLVSGNSFTGSMPSSVCDLRTSGILEDLHADCAPPDIQLECDLGDCCTRCF
mmetsp:Transcript_686/g.950  ORF Transcript_686/g.950 Transcript_686/m.950 type:complete len:180 (-) Transcript_686:60-599(-)